ncbi:MotA/TolQ/ExbB proton channel family protein [Candidatus Igneacidithiobacillus taiwanensis]|uniref:MotA/TolQ/ExbB proton channel family protein n=1 Tax=Candidatus Igneacidithiobacillus taiwanensis TaxID=1945924 RepID=UPI00289ECEC0|nr:MotA/TolQ/ExbB proton channel family protein [Candidatus Igneacidithiobacillus taiwanensis]MCE5360599.1 MotA/TolQ/ExbB proton channel family protein [Acidithiobacillus sp.]
MNLGELAKIAAESGGVLYLMPILLFIVLWVSFERFLYLNRMTHLGEQTAQAIDALPNLQGPQLKELADSTPAPFKALLEVPVRYPQLRDSARLSDILQETVMRQVPTLDRGLWILDTTVTLAPLLGLLGTIIGMFHAFQVLDNVSNNPTAITGNVAEALLATASGLVIAIIGLVTFNGLHNRMRLVVHQMETLRTMLTNRLEGLQHVSNSVDAAKPVYYAAQEA